MTPGGSSLPAYKLHKGSGQAYAYYRGRYHYFGAHETPESRERYARFIAELAARPEGDSPPSSPDRQTNLLVAELCASYLEHAVSYYRKNGRSTNHLSAVQRALRYCDALYGSTDAADFGPLSLRAIIEQMIADGLARSTINDTIGVIKRVWKWAVSHELVPPATWQALQSVPGLRKGRTAARETEPILPVEDAVVHATLPFLPQVVADMVRFQRLTGCRPGEVCEVRPQDIDRSGDIWLYVPASHKTEHHGRQRVIYIGPKTQEVLRPYLLRAAEAFCFSPAEAAKKMREVRHAARKTPLSCGNRPGTNRKRRPKRQPGDRYMKDSYRRAITRAVAQANRARELFVELVQAITAGEKPTEQVVETTLRSARRTREDLERAIGQARRGEVVAPEPDLPNWHPNQLRHTAATQFRREFGLEAAQVLLGHAQANVTQVYAERDLRLGLEAAARIG